MGVVDAADVGPVLVLAEVGQRVRRLFAGVGVGPVGGEQGLGGVRRVVQGVVVLGPVALLDLGDLGADLDHRVAEAVELFF